MDKMLYIGYVDEKDNTFNIYCIKDYTVDGSMYRFKPIILQHGKGCLKIVPINQVDNTSIHCFGDGYTQQFVFYGFDLEELSKTMKIHKQNLVNIAKHAYEDYDDIENSIIRTIEV